MRYDVPSPEEAKARLGRVVRFLNLNFEVDLGDGWRPVRIGKRMNLYNRVRPQLSLFVFELEPLILTPYLPRIYGTFFATRQGYERGVISWVPTLEMAHISGLGDFEGHSKKVPFRPLSEDANNWFIVKLAQACGARFRSKQFLRQDRYEYTSEP